MVNINQLMKQAQEMQKKMAASKEEIENKEYEGKAGGKMVKVIITGKGEMKSIKLDQTIVDPAEIEMLEDLIVAAVNDAKSKLDSDSQGIMSDMFGGSLPSGFKMPF
jgi:DNA-binding YbaB/EbfC family protein